MKKWIVLAALCSATVCCATAGAVEPAYEGKLGNPEEPALRPFKWALSGVGALFYQTGKSFRDGNMNTPVLGSAEVLEGLGIGTIELGESTYNGMVYKPLTDHKEYQKTHRANKRIDSDLLLRNVRGHAADVVVSTPPTAGKHLALESDEKVAIRLEQAKEVRAQRNAARDARDPNKDLSRVERAQLKSVPERAEHGLNKKKDYSGNLLKLAK